MTVTTIRFPDNVYQKVKEMADFEGENVSTYMRNAVTEKVEDQQDYQEAIKMLEASTGTVPAEEVRKMVFGSNE
jgi:RHH-type transcriptional regulator, rel operon repressor / antitoxin RelB